MARVLPLRALRYELGAVGGLERVAAPPYDVIDERRRAELAARSPHNVVHVDLPRAVGGADPYAHAAELLERWLGERAVVLDEGPALWALEQHYRGPDGRGRTRRSFFCRVRVEEYGPGRIRPHERTHPGPKEDRLRLTRATRTNLSPIFSLFPDPAGAAWSALEPATRTDPWGSFADEEGTTHRLWPVRDPEAVAAVESALAPAELLIADGHHRYETARVYAEEIGGEGPHRHVLMCLCALSDPGLTIFPIHRLLSGLDDARRAALRDALARDFEAVAVGPQELEPPEDGPLPEFGFLEGGGAPPVRLTLRDPAIADRALDGRPDAYRRLDTAVLEAVVLRDALGMSEDDIAHFRGVAYANSLAEAREAVERGNADAAFFLRPTPVARVREVAATGESMPPKSTFFYPKVPTGLVFNPLEGHG